MIINQKINYIAIAKGKNSIVFISPFVVIQPPTNSGYG